MPLFRGPHWKGCGDTGPRQCSTVQHRATPLPPTAAAVNPLQRRMVSIWGAMRGVWHQNCSSNEQRNTKRGFKSFYIGGIYFIARSQNYWKKIGQTNHSTVVTESKSNTVFPEKIIVTIYQRWILLTEIFTGLSNIWLAEKPPVKITDWYIGCFWCLAIKQ